MEEFIQKEGALTNRGKECLSLSLQTSAMTIGSPVVSQDITIVEGKVLEKGRPHLLPPPPRKGEIGRLGKYNPMQSGKTSTHEPHE